MKITQLMLAKGFGGAERYFVDLSIALASCDHEVQVICNKKFKQFSLLESVPALQIQMVSPSGWWDIAAQRQIFQAIKMFKPDIVQAHLARGAYLAGKACSKLGIPLVVKTHNYVDLKYYKNVDCYVTTTADQKDYLLKHRVDENNIVVIPNFSSICPVDHVAVNTGNKTVLVSYGRFVSKKGFHILLEAMKILQGTGREIQLSIGGDGPERKSLMHQAARLGIEKQVSFPGWVENVKSFVKDADLFVLPSLDEPFGIAVLEMMALGKPIIATRTKGPLEILCDENSWLVEPGNVQELANVMIHAIENREEQARKATTALQLFKEKYARDVIVSRLVTLYSQLLEYNSD